MNYISGTGIVLRQKASVTKAPSTTCLKKDERLWVTDPGAVHASMEKRNRNRPEEGKSLSMAPKQTRLPPEPTNPLKEELWKSGPN